MDKKKKIDRKFLKRAVALGAVLGLLLALVLFSYLLVLSKALPSYDDIANRQIDQSTKIYDREGKVLLYEISAGEKRTLMPFDQIPQTLKDATIAVEDQHFYETPGFDWRGIVRAFFVNLKHGEIVQGGSSITQQLARNAFLTPEQTLTRKLKELLLAIKLSRYYSKDQILTLYLNEIPYGPTIYGAASASEAYFGKPLKEIGLAESAFLAAIPKAPSYYYPWGSHTKELAARQRIVLKRMLDSGKIGEEEYSDALSEKVEFQPQGRGIKAPHFIMSVQDYLIKKYGEEMVRTGGLTVETTLNWKFQEIAEKAVEEGAARNMEAYGGSNAALVAEDPKTGQILALVGSQDYFDVENEGNFNVATQGLRQPGSSLKPFVYLTGMKMGYTPETILFDAPTEFVPNNSNCPAVPNFNSVNPECFHPRNYDGKFRGPINIKSSLAQSINVTAVKMLYLVGLKESLQTLHNFGITTLEDPGRYGLSLVLGGGEVKLIDSVKAYSTLSQDGTRHEQTMILEIRDSSGKVLESYEDKTETVADPQYPRLINDILSDMDARAELFGGSINQTTVSGYQVALKTGTTDDYRDAWSMGYAPNLVVGVWAGNNDGSPMHKRGSSILAAVPIWHEFISQTLPDLPSEAFIKPDSPSANKPVLTGSYVVDNQVHSILYYLDKKDPLGPVPNPPQDPQFTNWETGVRGWWQGNPDKVPQAVPDLAENTFSPFSPQIQIRNPKTGDFVSNQDLRILADIAGQVNIKRITVFFNQQIIYQSAGDWPGNYQFALNYRPQSVGEENLLEIEAVDKNDKPGRATVILRR